MNKRQGLVALLEEIKGLRILRFVKNEDDSCHKLFVLVCMLQKLGRGALFLVKLCTSLGIFVMNIGCYRPCNVLFNDLRLISYCVDLRTKFIYKHFEPVSLIHVGILFK